VASGGGSSAEKELARNEAWRIEALRVKRPKDRHGPDDHKDAG